VEQLIPPTKNSALSLTEGECDILERARCVLVALIIECTNSGQSASAAYFGAVCDDLTAISDALGCAPKSRRIA
jgi:hypothetical protein